MSEPVKTKIAEEILPGVNDDLDTLDKQLTALFPDLEITDDPILKVELTEDNFEEFLVNAQSQFG